MPDGAGNGVKSRAAMATEIWPARVGPERLTAFRLGQLLVLFDVATGQGPNQSLDIDRLGYYDFFAANPYLIVEPGSRDRVELALAGFDERNLDYQSSSQRFSNRRARLQHDLALLVAYDLVTVIARNGRVAYIITERGRGLAEQFSALYALAYRRSAEIVTGQLKGLSDKRLREQAEEWLRAKSLLIDLYDS